MVVRTSSIVQLSASQINAPATTSALPGLNCGPPSSPTSERRLIDQVPTRQETLSVPTVPISSPLARCRMSTTIVAVASGSAHEIVPVTSRKGVDREATGSTVNTVEAFCGLGFSDSGS
jgi:hypothetical protein